MDFEHQLNLTFREVASDLCIDDVTVKSYSGRGMMGRSCLAIQGSNGNLDTFVAEVLKRIVDSMFDHFEAGHDEMAGEIRSFFHWTVDTIMDFQQDSMGFSIVRYWSNVRFEDQPSEPEEY